MSVNTLENMKMQNVSFKDLFPPVFFPKLLWLNFYYSIVYSAEGGLGKTRSYFQTQVVSLSVTHF